MGGEKIESGDPASLKEAVEIMKRAIALDPGFARAWTQLHDAYDVLGWAGVEPERSWKLAEEAAAEALRLDPNDPFAHVSMAFVLGQRNDFAGVKTELDTALRLAPNSAVVLTQYANWAATFADPAVGAEMADKAIRLDPDYPSWAATRFVAAYFFAGRFEDAVTVAERIPIGAYFPDTWFAHPSSLAMVGRADEAAALVKKALEANPDLTVEWWTNQPGYPDRDRALMDSTMRRAGFPLCATPEKRAELGRYWKLPECEQEPAKNDAVRP
jgi:tetratricopeptide (TPR) repeat protein